MKLVCYNRLRHGGGVAIIGLTFLSAWLATTAGGLAAEPNTKPEANPQAEASATNGPSEAAAKDVKSRSDGWRYVWHNNQWWYYTPQQHWLIYQGDTWQRYAPEASGGTAWNTRPNSRRSYSRNPSNATIYNPDLYTPYFGPPERVWLFRRLYGHDPI
jgi:hypothetical protein